jgi:hypothetical protein
MATATVTKKEKAKKNAWQTIGRVGVDAGMLLICDPCYIVGKGKSSPADSMLPQAPLAEEFEKSWGDFCDRLEATSTQLNYNMGQAGLGVVFDSGFGDGEYDVEAKIVDDRIQEIRIKFFD